MYPHFLTIPLPSIVQSRLATFCYGLPQVRWVEEDNFHLTLRYFGPLADHTVAGIQERLKNLFFPPFSLVLQGINHSHTKSNRGTIWVGITDNSNLIALKKEMNRHLRDLHLPPEERSFHPHIILGFYERLNPKRLGEYLTMYADYQSLPIEVTRCLLIRSLQTPKRVIYEVVEEYAATQLPTGED